MGRGATMEIGKEGLRLFFFGLAVPDENVTEKRIFRMSW